MSHCKIEILTLVRPMVSGLVDLNQYTTQPCKLFVQGDSMQSQYTDANGCALSKFSTGGAKDAKKQILRSEYIARRWIAEMITVFTEMSYAPFWHK